MNKKQFIQGFEFMRNMAELKALSNHSLVNPLSDTEFNKMMELKNKIMKGGNK